MAVNAAAIADFAQHQLPQRRAAHAALAAAVTAYLAFVAYLGIGPWRWGLLPQRLAIACLLGAVVLLLLRMRRSRLLLWWVWHSWRTWLWALECRAIALTPIACPSG